MSFIQIVTPEQTFKFSPADKCEMTLRVIDDDTEKDFRKKATKTGWSQHQRTTDFDAHEFLAQCIDYAIVSWKGVVKAGTTDELPCDRTHKLLLPEGLKLEIQKLTLGKEGGELAAVAEKKA